MDPITGFMLYGVCAVIVAAIAGKRGLSWSAYLLVILPLGPAIAIVMPLVTQGLANSLVTTTLAFCVPLAGLLVALCSKGPKPLTTGTESREQKGA
ncbi:hypothetical protein M0D69_14860 [Caballeronia sp. SEWSISQ10-4 2]|uniref:hypothetical protein n=1 Tax=Caballeronia sp. SEWSISQ10-4 2 TaxID=2937438 RepID=UPI00264AD5D3|nr:hypothetical protein [Caballeronia sp. SEWSISQ10-4 2]MDN7179252.1 hypothetical protein [Caballeronia sp. SEWSISQ10-4 2]